MEVRLIGKLEEVEIITRELRQRFTVTSERDYPTKKGDVRRYLKVKVEAEAV